MRLLAVTLSAVAGVLIALLAAGVALFPLFASPDVLDCFAFILPFVLVAAAGCWFFASPAPVDDPEAGIENGW